jgi:hypothetical protein
MPDADIQPNQWGVTLAISDEDIRRDLKRWDWGDWHHPIQIASIVFNVVREQTMASLSDDATTVVVGLCEFEIPLEIGLDELLDEWIVMRAGCYTGTLGDPDRAPAEALIQRLEATIAKLRAALEPQHDADHAA